MNRETQEKYVNQTLEVLKALTIEEREQEFRLMAMDKPSSEAFKKKYQELYGDKL